MDAGVPPTAIILRDPEHKTYSSWDLKLVAAYHIYQDLLRGSIPIYWDESDRVAFDVKTGVSKSAKALARKEKADSNKPDESRWGLYYYTVPRTIDGGPLPTRDEWLAERAAKQGKDDRRPGPPVG